MAEGNYLMNRMVLATFLIFTALAWGTVPSAAQEGTASPAAIEEETETFAAPVNIDGVELFEVRGTKFYPAERRAREIRDRIVGLAQDPTVTPDSVVTVETERTTEIFSGERRIMWVLNVDARLVDISRQTLARAFVVKIREAIERYRHDRRPEILRKNILFSFGATIVLMMTFVLFMWGFRKANRQIERRYKARIQGLKVGSFEIVRAEHLWKTLIGVLKGLHILVLLGLFYAFMEIVLSRFPSTRGTASRLLDLVLNPLKKIGSAMMGYLPDLVFLIVLIIVTRYLLKVVQLFFKGIERGVVTFSGFDREWAWPTYKILRVFIIAFAVVVAYPYIPGSDTDAFKGVSIFLGVIVSLGSSSALSNLIAGYTLIYRRAFKVGDRIRVGDLSSNLTGDVTERRALTTHLRTIKNEMIIVPNSLMLNSSIINYSKLAATEGLILHTTVGVGYEASWRQVEAMLLHAAKLTPGLLREPPPFVLQKSLDQFSVNHEINVYCDNPHGMAKLYAELHRNILDQFNQYGVQIMTPAYEGDPDNPKVVPQEKWHVPPAQPPKS